MRKLIRIAFTKTLVMVCGIGLLLSCNQMETFESPDIANIPETFKVVQKGSDGSEWARTVKDFCGTEKTVDLIAGQNKIVGEVSAYNDGNKLYITISTDGAWYIRKTHLYTGERSQTEGIKNPAPGRFPYSFDATSVNNYGVQEYTYEIDAENLKNWGEFDIAVHVDVVRVDVNINGSPKLDSDENATILQSEGAWGDGKRFNLKGNWATHFSYTLQSCDVSCTGSWFRSVSGRGNDTDLIQDIDFDEFDLMDGANIIGKVTYVRARREGSGSQPRDITVTFEITKTGYSFDEFSTIFRETTAYTSLTRSNFTQFKTTATGGTFVFENVSNGEYFLGLYSKITGLCK